MNIPQRFNQGDTFTWTESTSQYMGQALADGAWQVTLSFRGPVAIDMSATRTDGKFVFKVDKDQAAKFKPGRYRWLARLNSISTASGPEAFTVHADIVQNDYNLNNCSDLGGINVGDVVDSGYFNTPDLSPTTVTNVAPGLGQMTLSMYSSTTDTQVELTVYRTGVVQAPVVDSSLTVDEGSLEVLPDISQYGGGYDARSQAEVDLENVQAAMRAMINGGAVQEYQIGNRSVKKMSMESLMSLETRLKFQVARERRSKNIAAGLGDPSNVLVRFTR